MVIKRISQKEINNRLDRIEEQRSKTHERVVCISLDDNGYIVIQGYKAQFNYMDEALEYLHEFPWYDEEKTILLIDTIGIVPDDLYLPDELLLYYANAATRREYAEIVESNSRLWIFMYAGLLKENAKKADWLIKKYPVLADLLKHCENANCLYERYTDQKWFTGAKVGKDD